MEKRLKKKQRSQRKGKKEGISKKQGKEGQGCPVPSKVALGLCLVSSALYQQAPMRADAQALSETSKLMPDANKNKDKEGDLYTASADEPTKGKPAGP